MNLNEWLRAIAGFFVAGYGVFRFVAEFWREPDANLGLLGLGLSMGQWLSVPMILAGLGLWIFARKRALSDVEDGVDNSGDNDDPSSPEAEPTEGAEVPADKDSGPAAGDAATEAAAEPSVDSPAAEK